MRYKDALHILRMCGDVPVNGSSSLEKARTLSFVSDVKSEWLNYRNGSSWPEPDIQKESTYNDCIFGYLSEHKGKIKLEITLEDGDSVYGTPIKSRCKFVLYLKEINDEFDYQLNSALNLKAISLIEEEDRLAMENRIKAMTDKIMNDK